MRPIAALALIALSLPACSTSKTEADKSAAAARQQEVARLKLVIQSGKGKSAAGKPLFDSRCAACHTFADHGGKAGPNLTHYVWDNESLGFLLNAIVDPNSELHEFHTTMQITTKDGKAITGVILENDESKLTVIDTAGQTHSIPKSQVAASKPLIKTLMPDHILSGLGDQQVADLFAYLMSNSKR